MDINNFLKTLTVDDLVLTANRRLSSYLQKRHDRIQLDSGKNAWINLKIQPLSSWLEFVCNNHIHDEYLLLNDFQENLVWKKIVESSPAGENILNTSQTAKLCMETWRLLNNWLLSLDQIATSDSLDVLTFVSWAKQFQEICVKKKWRSKSNIIPLLIECLQDSISSMNLPVRIFFVGFDDISPALKKLQAILSKFITIEHQDFYREKTSGPKQVSYIDQEVELLEMVRWSYSKLCAEPTASIGCVLPNLAEKRQQIIRLFHEVYYADNLQQQFNTLPVNISAGESLLEFDIIEIVLSILSLNKSEILFEEISCLLRTPYLRGSESDKNVRSQLDIKLRSFGEKKVTIDYLKENNFFKSNTSLLISIENLLAIKQETLNEKNKKLMLEEWAYFFARQLAAIGWPGERVLSSFDYQLVERFKKLLDEYAALTIIEEKVDFSSAINLLHQLANSTIFQPKSEEQPIQVLGILEATGIEFDYLWVASLDDETWPKTPSPNPFIPFDLQKKYGMPHATAERELLFSEQVTNRLQLAAGEIIFSHGEYDSDRPLAPGPLIVNYEKWSTALGEYQSIAKKIFLSGKLEDYSDNVAPLVEQQLLIGGSGVFKSQAACPFQAFAKYRLRAEAMDDIQIGLAHHERGSIVHEVLAAIWTKIKNHQLLCELSDQELSISIDEIVDIVLKNIRSDRPFTLTTPLFQLEKKRLVKIIFNWLQLEKRRAPFEVISCEQKQTVNFGDMSLHIQIDRIDRLEDGSHLLIDYKTGKTNIMDWFGDRPDEPQIPLYSLLSELLLSGILFGQIRSDQMGFKGVVITNEIAPGAVTIDKLKKEEFGTIPELMKYWQKHLTQLAEDFRQGKAEVSPKDNTTCQYCQLQTLCRVNQLHKKS